MAWETQINLQERTLSICGELTIFSVADIRTRLQETLAVVDTLNIDLSEVTEIDTAGLQLMLLAKRKPGKTVGFCKHPEVVLRLIDLANLAQTLDDLLVMQAPQSA
ncbi:MAG: STAS domain-containing protein [Rhodoferax sp.]|nr:STAS domain-containing protein [Rhodoferax sp.]